MRISDWSSDVCSSDLLEIQAARLHIGIGAFLLQTLDFRIPRDTIVQPVDDGGRDSIGGLVERLANGNGSDEQVDAVADHIAQCRGPHQRKEEIGARLHPIETKRVCEAVGSIRQIDGRLFGDVENARDADRRVDREAADRFHSLSYLELEQEVQKIDRLSEIAQGVAKTITDRLRNDPLISLGDRPNESLVDRLDRKG